METFTYLSKCYYGVIALTFGKQNRCKKWKINGRKRGDLITTDPKIDMLKRDITYKYDWIKPVNRWCQDKFIDLCMKQWSQFQITSENVNRSFQCKDSE